MKPCMTSGDCSHRIITQLQVLQEKTLEDLDDLDLGFTMAQSVAVAQALVRTTFATIKTVNAHATIVPYSTNKLDEKDLADWVTDLTETFAANYAANINT